MKLADFVRLKKFMALATSTNDAEALAALRQANSLLEREALTWERVLDRSVKVIQAVEAAPESYNDEVHHRSTGRTDDNDIDDAIDTIERHANLKGGFEDTITSIIDQHRRGKVLTTKQRELLFRVANR